MQPAGVGRGRVARIGDLDGDRQRLVGEPVFEREREGERDRSPGSRSLSRSASRTKSGSDALDHEGLEPGEAVQAERRSCRPPTRAPSRVQPTTG